MAMRRRRYRTGRSRFREHMRVYRLIYLFGLLFLVAWLAFSWRGVWDWGRTYFMD